MWVGGGACSGAGATKPKTKRGENAGVDFPGVSLPGYEEGIGESMLGTDQRIECINLKEGANQII